MACDIRLASTSALDRSLMAAVALYWKLPQSMLISQRTRAPFPQALTRSKKTTSAPSDMLKEVECRMRVQRRAVPAKNPGQV